MPIFFRDYETKSTLDLGAFGVWRYSTHGATDIWCCAHCVDHGEIKLWIPGDPVPDEFITAAKDPDWLVAAFNDGFERLIEAHIMAPRYGFPLVPLERHRCLQASALALALPGSLEGAARALKLKQQKDTAGRHTMLQMAKPRRPRKGEDPEVCYWFDDPERLAQLHAHCRQDVAVERELYDHVGFLSDGEQALWILDTVINDRGIHVDRDLLNAAIKIAAEAQGELGVELANITKSAVENAHQTARLLDWLASQGCKVNDLRKPTLEKALARSDLSPINRRVIELRLHGAHAAAAKLSTMRGWLNPDNRVRGTLKFHGAATGRWSSHGIQLQNLKRPVVEDLDAAIAAVRTGNLEYVRHYYEQPMSVVGDIVRGLICAQPGHRLIAADFSGVESRITAWLSGQQSKLDQWATFDQTQNAEDEPYYQIGRKVFGVSEEHARATGKVADLAFGYMGGIGAWRKLAPEDKSTDDQIKRRQYAWRDAHKQTSDFWTALNTRAVKAVSNSGKEIKFQRPCWQHLSFKSEGQFLRMMLPSGRAIAYPFPQVKADAQGKPTVIFMDNAQGRWTECRNGEGAYGGIWLENAVQAVARDLFAAAMPRLESAGYKIILHIHDELVAEVPEGFGSAEEFLHILTMPPEWATGLPIAAKVREGPRFCKSRHPVTIELLVTETKSDAEAPQAPWRDSDASARAEECTEDWFESIPDAGANGHDEETVFNGYQSGERLFGRDVAEYIYLDANKQPFLKVHRTSQKQFPQFHVEDGRWVKGAPKGPRIPFMLPELLAAPAIETVWIAEGEKDALSVSDLGLIATTNSGGAGKWTPELNRWFAGKQATYVLEDNDTAGRAHARKVADNLQGVVSDIRIISFPELPEHGDVSDWFANGGTRQKLIDRAKTAQKYECKLRSARASSFTISGLEWIWPNRFAVGKLGIIAGLPDEGKGQILCDIAARITRGSAWPCNEGHAPQGNVILLTAEDDISDTVAPRLLAAGADLDRIEILQMVRDADTERMFSLVTDLELLRQKVTEVGNVNTIQIDPFSAYLGFGKIDSFRTTDVRAVLSPLVNLAAELKIAVVGIMHFNKKVDVTNALLRISDSLAFGATSRHVYAVVNDPENKRKLSVKGKNNLAPHDQKALAFEFGVREVGMDKKTGEPILAPHIIWAPEHVDVTASEAMQAAAESKAPAARDSAKQFLKSFLSDGPCASEEVEEAAEANGISRRTLFRVKGELRIQAVKDGPMKDGQRTWQWHLPSTETGDGAA